MNVLPSVGHVGVGDLSGHIASVVVVPRDKVPRDVLKRGLLEDFLKGLLWVEEQVQARVSKGPS